MLLHYKGYTGSIEPDVEAGVLFGEVLDIRDTITFQGETIEELKQAFHDSVDDYLEFCQERGEKPDKPFSGKLPPLRTTPEIHRKVFIASKQSGISMNAWMEGAIKEATERELVGL